MKDPASNRSLEASPQAYARLAGLIYLLVIVFGGFSEGYVMNTLVVAGDAAATGRNILGAPELWRWSVAGNLVVPVIAVVQLWIEYLLLRPVSRNLAWLFVFLNLASLAVEAVSKLFLLMVEPILNGAAGGGGAFAPGQVQALAHLALVGHDIAFNIALIFFGAACLVSGTLIFRSGYLPRAVGVLMQVAGASYLIASFSALVAPAFAGLITPWILLPPLVGESSLCLWLLVRGVNLTRWRAHPGLGQGA